MKWISRDIPLLLTNSRVDCSAGEVALAEQPVELSATLSGADEDDDLVELQAVKQIVQLAVLLALIELDVELLETVERELLLIVDVDLEGILHELLAYSTDILGERGREHHHLLVGRSSAEDRLHIVAHVCSYVSYSTGR